MKPYTEVRSHYLKRKIQSTLWKDHDLIDELRSAENIIAKGGPKSFNEAMAFQAINNKHPIAVFAMKQELCFGKILSEAELYNAYELHTRPERERKLQEQIQARVAEDRRRHQAFLDWLNAGGQP